MYRNLDAQRIVETSHLLQQRVAERFPDSGLSRVSSELLSVVEESSGFIQWLRAPNWPIRIFVWFGALAIVAIFCGTILTVSGKEAFATWAEFFQGMDAAINDVVFVGIGIYFLLSIETRLKRKRALRALHVLRSIAHIIDMHQLTKDPERTMGGTHNTQSSPKRVMTPFELTRYLDYCSEMLSITSKLAALYVQHFNDPITLAAVNEVENLTSGLSRKIWQKIMILDHVIAPKSNANAG